MVLEDDLVDGWIGHDDVVPDVVLDFLGTEAEAEGGEGLVELGETGVDAEDDGGPGVASEGGLEELGEWGVAVGDVEVAWG